MIEEDNCGRTSQLDYGFDKKKICPDDPDDYMKSFRKKYTNHCKNLCPIDCLKEEYMLYRRERVRTKLIKFDQISWKTTLDWDGSKPTLLSKETPVMTFTDYFCYIGGLFGMWFGINANELIVKLIESRAPIYRKIIHFSLFVLYIYVYKRDVYC
jgi:hypothetical protein